MGKPVNMMIARKVARPRKVPDDEPLSLQQQLREDILNATLAPGRRLKFDDLRAQYEASVGALREALVQLSADGLVVSHTNRGFQVASVSVAELLDITDLRVDLEARALSASIERGGDTWESNILSSFHLLKKSIPDLQRDLSAQPTLTLWDARHSAFHDSLVAACPSIWVLRFRAVLFNQARRYRSLSLKHSFSPGRLSQHERMMQLCLKRDVLGACALAELHIRETTKTILKHIGQWEEKPLEHTEA